MSQALADKLTATERERRWPNQAPRNAATLIVIDRRGAEPKVLMGKRHGGHKFMPGKFVFPGGRLEADDRRMPAAGELEPRIRAALDTRVTRPSASLARGLALAALRETFEETGLLIGQVKDGMPQGPRSGPWRAFFDKSVLPDLAPLRYVGRAITPPRRPKRFDTRFFAVDREAIAAEEPGFVGPDKELVELAWVNLDDARKLDLPAITVIMLDELQSRIDAGFASELPVPFYFERHRRFVRELL